jgi:epothilone polyketide synthase A
MAPRTRGSTDDSTPQAAADSPADPIALVGVGCRLPGGVVDLSGLWERLQTVYDAVAPLPGDRPGLSAWPQAAPALPGVRRPTDASFLADIAGFDAAFFDMPPRHAAQLDPGHRLLLEVCWEALEHAGLVPASLLHSTTGLFVGIRSSEYEAFPRHAATAEPSAGLGTLPSVAVGAAVPPPRSAWTRTRCRHELLLFAGRCTPRLPEPACG